MEEGEVFETETQKGRLTSEQNELFTEMVKEDSGRFLEAKHLYISRCHSLVKLVFKISSKLLKIDTQVLHHTSLAYYEHFCSCFMSIVLCRLHT